MDEEMRKIDVNRADVAELSQIPGIAENLARRIIEYRETVHPFEEVIELAAVPGISERMVHEFADWVTVEPVAAMERSVTIPGIALEPKAVPDVTEVDDEAEIFEFVTETAEEEFPEDIEETVEEVEPVEAKPAADEADTAKLPPLVAPSPVQTTAQPQPRPAAQPSSGPSQGRVLAQILLGSILGAFVGALLTLAVLAAINNGTLSFTQADTRLQNEIQNAQQAQNDLQQTVDNLDTELNTNLGYVATRTGDLFLQQQETDASLQDITAGMRQTNINVTELQAVTEALDERLTTVAAAAETFDAFLDGLRGLLIDLDGGTGAVPETTTPEATIGATPTTGSAATAVPSPTGRPTRTPRPTATPIPLPTSTPGQQP